MPTDKKQVKFSLPPVSLIPPTRHTELTREELLILSKVAKVTALSGNRELTERYRRQGVSLDTIARAIGASGNWDYAQFLVEENPQALNLANELAIGFKMIGDHVSVKKLIAFGADSSIVSFGARYSQPLPTHIPLKSILRKNNTMTAQPPTTTNTAFTRKVVLPEINPATVPCNAFFQSQRNTQFKQALKNSEPLFLIDSGSEESFTLD